MMASMPKGLTAATGMDALTHAIEGYITKGALRPSLICSIWKAIELIARVAARCGAKRPPKAARAWRWASISPAWASPTWVWASCTRMAHGLSALYDTPHGVACAILLPVGLEYNKTVAGERYRAVGKAMGVTGIDEMNDVEAARRDHRRREAAVRRRGHSREPEGHPEGRGHSVLGGVRVCGCVPPRQSPRHQCGRDRGAVQEPAVRVSRKRLWPLPRGFATFADQRSSKVARKRFCFAKSYTREPGRVVLYDDSPADGAGWSAKKAPAFLLGRQVLLAF